MQSVIRISIVAAALMLAAPISNSCAAGDEAKKPAPKADSTAPAHPDQPTATTDGAKATEEPPPINLLEAVRDGRVAVEAEGREDGRITVAVTNRTRKTLRVVLPPGIIAQGATGQMGGMGGGMGGMGGMGGGMGGGRMGGMGGGMMGGRTMPPMMGMMMLARMIMYFCGDYESWDMRSLMMGMGGMGMGMGGGMMGGMGGGMGGMMGGGMRSVPPTGLPFADLKPGQTRKLPTRMVSLEPPDPQGGVRLPREGEAFRLGDIAEVNRSARVQKALRLLAAGKASTQVSQLVMWNVSAGLDWGTIAEVSSGWSNRFALALAKDFVDRLDREAPADMESGRIFFGIQGEGATGQARAAALRKALDKKVVLGLHAGLEIPARPGRPALACRVKIKAHELQVQLDSSNATATAWVPLGKFSLKAEVGEGEDEALKAADSVVEGLVSRVVRATLIKGDRVKGKLTYGIRIENASPLRLNGLAAVGHDSKPEEKPRVLAGISIPPHRTMTVPASEEVVKLLGLKHGIRVTALDLSGL